MFGLWLDKVLNGCSNIYRWEGRQKLIRKNDSEHSFGVALIADGLARWEIDKFGNDVKVDLVLRKCIFHDVVECVSGDILSSVKKQTPAMKKALEEVEYILYKQNLEPLIPEAWRKDYEGYLLNPKDNKETIEGRIVAVADSIDALNECIQEVRLGNNTFKPYLEDIANAILDIDLESGHYFLKNSLVDFGLPLDFYGSRVKAFIENSL